MPWTDPRPTPPRQLLVYGFHADPNFEGRLVGALERMESGGALRIVEAHLRRPRCRDGRARGHRPAQPRRRQPGVAADRLPARIRASGRAGRDVRSRPSAATRFARSALRSRPAPRSRRCCVEHTWARALADAMSQSGGTPVSSGFVEAETLSDLTPLLVAAAAATDGTAPPDHRAAGMSLQVLALGVISGLRPATSQAAVVALLRTPDPRRALLFFVVAGFAVEHGWGLRACSPSTVPASTSAVRPSRRVRPRRRRRGAGVRDRLPPGAGQRAAARARGDAAPAVDQRAGARSRSGSATRRSRRPPRPASSPTSPASSTSSR